MYRHDETYCEPVLTDSLDCYTMNYRSVHVQCGSYSSPDESCPNIHVSKNKVVYVVRRTPYVSFAKVARTGTRDMVPEISHTLFLMRRALILLLREKKWFIPS